MAPKDEGPRAFARFIEALADGDAHDQLSNELHELGQRLLDESLKRDVAVTGELTLKLKLKADPKGMVGIAYDIKRKDPARRTSAAVMWLTGGGNLSPTNPKQPDLPGLREVPPAQAETRDVGGKAAMKEV